MSAAAAPKLLCLHGFLQNAKIFSEKSSGLRKLLKKANIQLDYIDGPVTLEKADLPFEVDDDKWKEIVDTQINKAWFYHFDEPEKLNIDAALETVFTHIKENGPYDGIIGFSQGAAISTIVANLIAEKMPEHGPFKLALHVSGYCFTDRDADRKELGINSKFTKEFTVPEDFSTKTLIIYGENDNSVPSFRSQYLSNLFANKTEFKHDGGHFVPNKKDFLKGVVEEIEAAVKQ
ncbi:hypothetical protein WICPIJ_009192 [Wickerhamomyces pijperi]|uniref:Serine hydrolase domain-containing protein n=1 Tax=Wickerhamomyces pijperi TaxID=599730 RepID=A0A9P8PQ62_WICPI|nr:hypothetical protein WICPIJ_009192 [Wickerhamomyces pijperi]